MDGRCVCRRSAAAAAEGGAPYICKSPNDVHAYVGFEVEIAAALEKQLGRKIQFVQYDFKSLTSGLQRGDFDFAMNGVEMTPDRIKALRFSRPYYIYTLLDHVVVLADGKIIEDGAPTQVLDHPQAPRTQQFLSQLLA